MMLQCLNPNYKEKVIIRPIKTSYKKLDVSEEVSDGKLIKKSVYKDFDFVENVSMFTSSDFSLQNILATGATNMLRPVYMASMHDMDIADKFENYTLNIENIDKNELV